MKSLLILSITNFGWGEMKVFDYSKLEPLKIEDLKCYHVIKNGKRKKIVLKDKKINLEKLVFSLKGGKAEDYYCEY